MLHTLAVGPIREEITIFEEYGKLTISNRGTPKWMVKIMENPIKTDDLGVPLFSETPIWRCVWKQWFKTHNMFFFYCVFQRYTYIFFQVVKYLLSMVCDICSSQIWFINHFQCQVWDGFPPEFLHLDASSCVVDMEDRSSLCKKWLESSPSMIIMIVRSELPERFVDVWYV